jgi:hypothetical protein
MPEIITAAAERAGVFSPDQLNLMTNVYEELCAEHRIGQDDVRRQALAIALTFPEHAFSDRATLKAAGLRAITFT